MDKQPLKIAAIVGVIVVALAGLVLGMRTVGKGEEYAPSPGAQGMGGHMADGRTG